MAVCSHGFVLKIEPLEEGERYAKHELLLYDLMITEQKVRFIE